MIELTRIYYFIFGLLTIVGGVIGYVSKQSVVSLVAGGISGVLLLVSGYLLPDRFQTAFIIGIIVCVALTGNFLPHVLGGKPKIHSLIMAVMGVIGAALTLLAWYKLLSSHQP